LTCIVSPNEVDAKIALSLLTESGIHARAFGNLRDLAAILDSTIGCVILVEDALISDDIPALREALERLPAWFDLPLIVAAHDVAFLGGIFAEEFPNSGNVTFLERPLNFFTLVSAVRVGLRAASRQWQVGELLAEKENAVKLRDEFLAMLAHELRNPLAPMVNAIYMMRLIRLEDPQIVNVTDVLERQINHVKRMVDDLMDVARLERSKLTLQKSPADLNRVVSGAVDSSLVTARARGQTINCQLHDRPLPVTIDSVRVEQIVCNLINNAIKFTPTANEILVKTSISEGFALIAVKDNGIGFLPEKAESLFTPFLQANPTIARSAGGLGIGLTIVRRLAELHGGSVHASSEGPGKSACFVIQIPLATINLATVETRGHSDYANAHRRIVVVEDNSDIRETLRSVLGLWGHDVFAADDGISGLELIQREQPDIALVDVGLPALNGYEVAKAVKAVLPKIKLIAMTGYGQPADKLAAMDAGFDHHLLKPVEPELLRELLARN